MSIPRRPGRGESDEDLLKFQEEFLAKKETPSVKIIKKNDALPREIRENGKLSSCLHGLLCNNQTITSNIVFSFILFLVVNLFDILIRPLAPPTNL